ncbi:hypothetical protein ACN47E_000761 [Coniothyrium glycines]
MSLSHHAARACAAPARQRRYLGSVVPVTAPARREHLKVPCRSNGFITIDLYRASNPLSPIIIYLPSGPVLQHCSGAEESLISRLHASSSATVAAINYRASSIHQYPTPCHDVLFGYDWLTENVLQDEYRRTVLTRVGVCGQLIGGSLATMLALTECRLGESRIGAAAINNPIIDWVFADTLPFVEPSKLPEPLGLDDTSLPAEADLAGSICTEDMPISALKHGKKKTKSTPLTSWQAYGDNSVIPTSTLSLMRDTLFRRPEDYFDRFASPIHMFRSPHAELVVLPEDQSHASQKPESHVDMEAQFSLDHYAAANFASKALPEMLRLARCRSYARNYPPAGSTYSLPAWNISTGSRSPLSDHALELVKMLRRSIARQTLKNHTGRARWHDMSEKENYEQLAQQRIHTSINDGLGLWAHLSDTVEQQQHSRDVGMWMKQRLLPESD